VIHVGSIDTLRFPYSEKQQAPFVFIKYKVLMKIMTNNLFVLLNPINRTKLSPRSCLPSHLLHLLLIFFGDLSSPPLLHSDLRRYYFL
jgi:hypothetical protein